MAARDKIIKLIKEHFEEEFSEEKFVPGVSPVPFFPVEIT